MPFDSRVITTSLYRKSPPTRFGDRYRADLNRSEAITCFLNLNAVEIESAADGGSVTGIRLATLDGKTVRATARIYVLALGGIENARLMLLSNRVQPGGIGNQLDLVGRYFMDHVIVRSGKLVPIDVYRPMDLYDYHLASHGVLVFNEAILARYALPNATVYLRPRPRPTADGVRSMRELAEAFRNNDWPEDLDRHVGNMVRDFDDVAGATYRKLLGRPWPTHDVAFQTRIETIPKPENRVVLSGQKDRLGQNRVRLHWRRGREELAAVRKFQEIIGHEAGRAGIGRVKLDLAPDAVTWPDSRVYGPHHMGTTRMADKPGRGVVDANCRVHGFGNFFVAGSSVFPTSGASNPTLTIVALALRLADRIKAVLA